MTTEALRRLTLGFESEEEKRRFEAGQMFSAAVNQVMYIVPELPEEDMIKALRGIGSRYSHLSGQLIREVIGQRLVQAIGTLEEYKKRDEVTDDRYLVGLTKTAGLMEKAGFF